MNLIDRDEAVDELLALYEDAQNDMSRKFAMKEAAEVIENISTIEFTPEYAERRLEEAIKNGTESDINYWRGYRDAVKRMMDNAEKN